MIMAAIALQVLAAGLSVNNELLIGRDNQRGRVGPHECWIRRGRVVLAAAAGLFGVLCQWASNCRSALRALVNKTIHLFATPRQERL